MGTVAMARLPMHASGRPPVPAHALPDGHLRIASLLAPDRDTLVAALSALGPDVDAAEVRLDGLWRTVPDPDVAADDLEAVLRAATVPLLATLRPTRQGGLYGGDETVRAGLLVAAARAGFAGVDLEADVMEGNALVPTLQAEASLVLSHHATVPPGGEDGGRLLLSMQDRHARLDKLAFAAGSYADVLRALELARLHALRGGRPALSTLGVGGVPLRALLPLVGNHATYGHAASLPPAAPGQPALADVQALWTHWGLGKADLDALARQPAPWLGVLGTPILHSLSPRLHNAALRAAGRRERFGALEVPASPAALRMTCMLAQRIGLWGASVTSPHKVDALRMAPADEVAKAVGASNCLRFGDPGPAATNTDATAMRRLLAPDVQTGEPAVVLGAGGMARAAIWALQELGADVTFTSRDPARAQAVTRHLGTRWVPWDRRGELARARVVVQAAALPSGAPSPWSGRPAVAVDAQYADGLTSFGRDAAASGAKVVHGRALLLEQAVDAYRFWLGEAPDRSAMASSVEEPA